MSTNKELNGTIAIDKIKELAEDKICLFVTHADGDIVSRPMGTSKIDDDGTVWFMSRDESEKNQQVKHDSDVHLMYMNQGSSGYLSLNGRASITKDKEKIKELWSPIAKAWFEDGVDDPAISLIAVKIVDGHYWDTKHGKIVSMLKIAAAALGAKKSDDGVEGDLKVATSSEL